MTNFDEYLNYIDIIAKNKTITENCIKNIKKIQKKYHEEKNKNENQIIRN